MAKGRGVKLWEEALSAQIYLGGEGFVKRMQSRAAVGDDREIPRAQRRTAAPPLTWYFDRYDRDAAIVRAYLDGGYTQTAIARASDLSVSRVSRLITRHEAKGKT